MVPLVQTLAAAQTGPVFEAELIPFTNQGKLRVTYNWLYSALNCDPNDGTAFAWIFSKLDDTRVTISPKYGYGGRTLYASVRDDNGWYLQVQAPYSADWITGAGRDEFLTITGEDLLIITLKGFNGEDIAVDGGISDHGGHAGYRLRSIGSDNLKSRLWFAAIDRSLQAGLAVTTRSEVTEADIQNSLAACEISASPAEIAQMHVLVTSA